MLPVLPNPPNMRFQFNSDNTISGTDQVAERIETQIRERLGRFEDRLTRIEVHVGDSNGPKGGGNDIGCRIEVRPRSGDPVSTSAQAGDVDAAARQASAKMVSLLDSHFGKAGRRQP